MDRYNYCSSKYTSIDYSSSSGVLILCYHLVVRRSGRRIVRICRSPFAVSITFHSLQIPQYNYNGMERQPLSYVFRSAASGEDVSAAVKSDNMNGLLWSHYGSFIFSLAGTLNISAICTEIHPLGWGGGGGGDLCFLKESDPGRGVRSLWLVDMKWYYLLTFIKSQLGRKFRLIAEE